MKKISENDLYWALSHKDEKVWKPVFEYWVRQWLCHPASATKEQALAWQNDERLQKLLPPEDIEQRLRAAVLSVIANAEGFNYSRFDAILDSMGVSGSDDANSCRIPFIIAVIRRLHTEINSVWKSSEGLEEKFAGYLTLLPFEVNNPTLYQLVPAAMQFPEIYNVLKDKIEWAVELGNCGSLVDDLLENAYIHRDKTYELLQLVLSVTHKCGHEFFDYLLSLQRFNLKCDVYSRKLKEESLKIIDRHGVFVDEKWFDLLDFATSGLDDRIVCLFGIEWRLKVCDILLERINGKNEEHLESFLYGLKELAKDTSVHGLSRQYLPLFRKFIKKYPKYKSQVLDIVDTIVSSYAKTVCPEGAYDDAWAVYNIDKYRSEAADLIKYGLQLAVSKNIKADRWKYTHIMLEMILYNQKANPEYYEEKIKKMLSYPWCYDNCAGQMIQVLTVYVKIGKEDMTNRMLYVKSLIFPIIDKMLNFYPLTGDNTAAVAEFCKLYMPLQPDYWQKCQACVEENLKKESDRQQKELEKEAFRINRILTAISE